MKVYIVFIGYDYEGADVIGVYLDKDKAELEVLKLEGHGDTQYWKEYEVN